MAKIPEWALEPEGGYDIEPGVEVRKNDDGTIDEVVFAFPNGGSFHLEQMDSGTYWIGIHWIDADGIGRMQHVTLSTAKRARLYPTVYC